jgi:hypothetical protein
MKKAVAIFMILIFLLLTGIASADKGQLWPYPVRLAEESQKAIILHNQGEEVLILGTALKADQKIGVLEFIPFPAEPTVSQAKGNPFKALQELISKKKLHYEIRTKGGDGVVSVEIKFEAQMGLHDVTIIKINDLDGFSQWVTQFFKKKGIPLKNNLSAVYQNAGDYLKRGFNYFVFDYILLGKEAKNFEPLIYKFQSEQLYYPLKTSNIIGGEGRVDLALILPGSLGLLKDHRDLLKLRELFNSIGGWELSSSAKAYPDELKPIYPEAGEFFKDGKIYLQVLRFVGKYQFSDDLQLDISNIAPFAYKHTIYRSDYNHYSWGGDYELAEPLTPDEKKDIAEAYSQKRPEWIFEPAMMEAAGVLVNPEEGDLK